MPLSLKQLQDVCLIYTNDSRKCKYLAQDDSNASVWYCLKKSSKKAEVDDETNDYLKDLKKKGIDPRKQGTPLGDNCDGYPILRYIKQGYDQK
jgi:hypothetical protein